MDIALNAHVECSDGPIGKVENIIVNPAHERVTHLVVRENDVDNTLRLIPEKMIQQSTKDKITLWASKEKFRKAPDFLQEEFIPANIMLYLGEGVGDLPATPASVRTLTEDIPTGGMAIHHGAKVYAADGHIGKVDEFLMEKKTGRITHLILKEGHLWGKKEITLPVGAIEKYEEGNVYLKLDKKAVEQAPQLASA